MVATAARLLAVAGDSYDRTHPGLKQPGRAPLGRLSSAADAISGRSQAHSGSGDLRRLGPMGFRADFRPQTAYEPAYEDCISHPLARSRVLPRRKA